MVEAASSLFVAALLSANVQITLSLTLKLSLLVKPTYTGVPFTVPVVVASYTRLETLNPPIVKALGDTVLLAIATVCVAAPALATLMLPE